VFGRGGEEMDFLQEKGIQVQVVPGMKHAMSSAGSEYILPAFSYNAYELSVPLQAL
jgi:siroheme synthase